MAKKKTKGPQVSVVNEQEADPWTWHLTESSPRGQAGELLLLFEAKQGADADEGLRRLAPGCRAQREVLIRPFDGVPGENRVEAGVRRP